MDGFVKPKRGTHGNFGWFLYLDGKQVIESLSAVEGGFIEEINSKSVEETNKGLDKSGALGGTGAKAEGGASKNRQLVYEEEVSGSCHGFGSPLCELPQDGPQEENHRDIHR